MPSIKIELVKFISNNHILISLDKSNKDSFCDVCGKNNITLLTADNSDGDNTWVAICQKCCNNIFSQEDGLDDLK